MLSLRDLGNSNLLSPIRGWRIKNAGYQSLNRREVLRQSLYVDNGASVSGPGCCGPFSGFGALWSWGRSQKFVLGGGAGENVGPVFMGSYGHTKCSSLVSGI